MLQRWGAGRGQTTDDAVQSETHNRHTELKYTFTDKNNETTDMWRDPIGVS